MLAKLFPASALRAVSTYRPGVSSVRTWLFASARNAARRTKRRAREVPADDLDARPLLDLGLAAGWGAEAPDLALERAEGRERLGAEHAVDDATLERVRASLRG